VRPLPAVAGGVRMIAMDSRLERQARNEALVREVNERIERLVRVAEEARPGDEPERFDFICECGAGGDEDIACAERIEMTVAEYEDLEAVVLIGQTARASTSLLPVAPLLGRDPRAKDRNSGDDQQRGQPPGKKDRGQPDDEDREARHVQDDSRPHVGQRNARGSKE
jgi:hypothetical protein